MTKDHVIEFRDHVAKGNPMKIICDNEHTFYYNIPGYFPIIWDDDYENFTTVMSNQDQYSDAQMPYCIVTTEYEHIQFMEAYKNVKEMVQYLSKIKDKLTEEEYEHSLELLRPGASSRVIKYGTALPTRSPI